MAQVSRDRYIEGRDAIVAAYVAETGAQPLDAEKQILIAQGLIESGFGHSSYHLLDHALSTPDKPVILASSGVINNWGAVQTDKGPPDGFLATDTGPGHKSPDNPFGYYDHFYRVYPTSAEGARSMVHEFVTRRPSSWEYARRGDIDGWAREAHAEKTSPNSIKKDPVTGVGGYFEQKPETRAKRTAEIIEEYAGLVGEPVAARRGGPVTSPTAPAPSPSGPSSSDGATFGIAAFVGTLLTLLFRRWRR